MKRRKDGRYLKVKTIDGEKIYFYSSEKTEKAATKDIENQMLEYVAKKDYEKHNFGILAKKMIEEKAKTAGNSTIVGYYAALKHLSILNEFNIEDITPAMVQNLIEAMANDKHYSYSAVTKVKITYGLVEDYAIIHEKIKLTKFAKLIKIPKTAKKGKIKAPTDDIIKTIVKASETIEHGMWAMILLCTGLRRGELAALKKSDLDFKQGLINIDKAVEFINNRPCIKSTPKTEESIGTVPILDILQDPLKRYVSDLRQEDYLFGGEKPLSETMVKKRWKKYCTAIGYDFNGHQLRHAYAKLLYKAGVDPKTAQRLLRHADFNTTMNIYTEFSKEVTDKSIVMINSYITNSIK